MTNSWNTKWVGKTVLSDESSFLAILCLTLLVLFPHFEIRHSINILNSFNSTEHEPFESCQEEENLGEQIWGYTHASNRRRSARRSFLVLRRHSPRDTLAESWVMFNQRTLFTHRDSQPDWHANGLGIPIQI